VQEVFAQTNPKFNSGSVYGPLKPTRI